jgi:hypothetical protein
MVVGCSEAGVAVDFLVEPVGGEWVADSSNIFIRGNQKRNSLELIDFNK